jgi:hypothetical protein
MSPAANEAGNPGVQLVVPVSTVPAVPKAIATATS